VAVPIKYRGAVWGVIEAINKHDGVFSERDREMLEALAGSAAIALENARLYQAEREQTHRLKESQAKLIHAEKMSALGRLAASLTHEINNPLQALHSGLGLIQAELSEDADPADVLRDLQIIDQEVKRISDLMLRLREFSRPVGRNTSH
jgi:GAF domain-containing protein